MIIYENERKLNVNGNYIDLGDPCDVRHMAVAQISKSRFILNILNINRITWVRRFRKYYGPFEFFLGLVNLMKQKNDNRRVIIKRGPPINPYAKIFISERRKASKDRRKINTFFCR